MLPILYFEELNYSDLERSFTKVLKQLTSGDFKSAEVKKLGINGYYRAKLNIKDRLLFTFAGYQGKNYLLLLEVIKNHDYAKSRFLRGAAIPDEQQLNSLSAVTEVPAETIRPLSYLNSTRSHLHLLNKFISFDEVQDSLFSLHPPLVIIGSAGSGKTVLVLEKLKQFKGNVAYLSLSRYLVENARKLYYAHEYNNEDQEIDFLSFQDYLESWKIPGGKELRFPEFKKWFLRHAPHLKLKEPYRIFEEFKGVITGSPVHAAWLSKEEYLELGIKQSIFSPDKRPLVYELFEKYLLWLKENNYFDSNILSFRYLDLVKPRYDYIMIDEVQDITNIQLKCILQSLIHKNNFVLTGDSNQIVHPNFFSWSKIKTYFYQDYPGDKQIRILQTNYRNSPQVVEFSNTLLKIKNARFGSIDKESNYLINTISTENGEVVLLPDHEKIKSELNKKTQDSTRFAVIVSDDLLKQEARRIFKTPLIFSVHEVKGLEYENVILLNFISANPEEFQEIIRDVQPEDLMNDSLTYSRPADKNAKDAEVYKFYVNSLYVAITRSIKNIYLFESQLNHRIFPLLHLQENKQPLKVSEQKSDRQEWLTEADRLEEQGKYEQAEEIRAKMYGYEYMNPEQLEVLKTRALDPTKKEHEVKKERKYLFQYAIKNFKLDWVEQLASLGFQRAILFMKEVKQDRKEYAKNCRLGRENEVTKMIHKYGVDCAANDTGATGLMLACYHGQHLLMDFFMKQNASLQASTSENWLPIHYLVYGFIKHEFYKEPFTAVKDTLVTYWHLLRPPSIAIQTSSRRFQVAGHSMLFFLLVIMRSADSEVYSKISVRFQEPGKTDIKIAAFSLDMVMRFVSRLPDEILPPYRKKRQYVNSILAMHEVDREHPYNKQAFKRVDRGVYIIHPSLGMV